MINKIKENINKNKNTSNVSTDLLGEANLALTGYTAYIATKAKNTAGRSQTNLGLVLRENNIFPNNQRELNLGIEDKPFTNACINTVSLEKIGTPAMTIALNLTEGSNSDCLATDGSGRLYWRTVGDGGTFADATVNNSIITNSNINSSIIGNTDPSTGVFTTITANNFISTVSTGTAPLTVNSSTKVDNLHASQVTGTVNVSGGDIDDILIQTSSNHTGFLTKGVSNTALTVGSSGNLAYEKVTNDMLAGSIVDDKLLTITTVNKVSGSAIQLQSNKGLEDNTGLGVKVDNSSLEIDTNGSVCVKDSGIDLTSKVTKELPITNGGTAASNAAQARKNLGIDAGGMTALTEDTILVEGRSHVNNTASLTHSLPTPSAENKVIIIHAWESFTLNNGNSQTASISANKIAICISIGDSVGEWTVKTTSLDSVSF